MLKAREVLSERTLDLHGAFVRRTDWSGTSLRGANMTGTDAANAIFRNSDFGGAVLDGAILRGADLSGARNLTIAQLSRAVIDKDTILPSYIDRNELASSNASE